MSKTWCALPWIHMCVRPNEQIKPCCRFQFEDGDADIAPTIEHFDPNNSYWTKLRQDMLDGVQRHECRKCYEQERVLTKDSPNQSLRNWMNSVFSTVDAEQCTSAALDLRYIEMSLDNLCNFECKMCDSKFSSKLQLRDQHMGWRVHKKLEPNFEKFDRFDLTKLEYIKLLGGEPLLSPNLKPFLNYISSRGAAAEQIQLQISTNGSKPLEDSLIERLQRFKHIEISVSLDTYDKSNDYQRIGGFYELIFKNALWYKQVLPNSRVNFHSVIGIYTANHLSKTMKFLREDHGFDVSVDWIRDPSWQSLLIAPEQFIQWLLEQNNDYAYAHQLLENFVKGAVYDADSWQTLLNNTKQLDEYHKKQLNDYNPLIYERLYNETYSV